MKKRIFSLLLVLILSVALLPSMALADTSYNLWVGGVQVTDANKGDITAAIGNDASGTASYDPATNTLTLDDFSYTGEGHLWQSSYYAAIYSNGDLDIVLENDNTVTCTANGTASGTKNSAICIQGGTLTIDGTGSLYAGGTPDYAIYGYFGGSHIEIKGGNITANGIYIEGFNSEPGSLEISGGMVKTKTTAESAYSITVEGPINISGENTLVEAKSITATYVNSATINISGGTVNVDGTIQAKTGINISGEDTSVTAKGISITFENYGSNKDSFVISGGEVTVQGNDRAIDVMSGNIVITGGKVTATGSDYGIRIRYYGSLTISGENTSVTATGSAYGIWVESNGITISGGKVTATGDDVTATRFSAYGIRAYADITISGGTVTATGGKVPARGNSYGIYSYHDSVSITGGKVIAEGYNNGIYANVNITIEDGTVTANSDGQAMNKAPAVTIADPYKITASVNKDGSSPVDTYTTANIGTYKYIKIAPNVSYNIAKADTEHGRFEVSAASATEGTEVTITVDPAEGYEVESVTYNGTEVQLADGVYKFEMPDSNVTVTVTFKGIPYSITTAATTNGTFTVPASATTGTEVTISAVPAEGYVVSSFTVYKTGDENTTVNVTDGKFTMPACAVTVSVTFELAPQIPDTPTPPSSSRSDKNKVTAEAADNGTIDVSRKSAAKGSTVIITVTPEAGYKLASLQVVDSKGNEIELKDLGDGRFSFEMPARKVSIKAEFAKIERENPFTDISEADEYYEAVLWAVENGITSGFTSTTFAPNAPCTRAQMMTFIWRSVGCPAPASSEHPFTDVKDDYYLQAVLWAVEQGITVGTTPTTFGPDEPCSRAHMATFLFRLAEDKDITLFGRYDDVAMHKYYALPVEWAAQEGYIDGISEDLFAPEDVSIRAAMVTALFRMHAE